jgi:hypothetical protein
LAGRALRLVLIGMGKKMVAATINLGEALVLQFVGVDRR